MPTHKLHPPRTLGILSEAVEPLREQLASLGLPVTVGFGDPSEGLHVYVPNRDTERTVRNLTREGYGGFEVRVIRTGPIRVTLPTKRR